MYRRNALNRRKALALGLGTLCLGQAAVTDYLTDKLVRTLPQQEGRIFADLHVHLGMQHTDEELKKVLSQGIVGLSTRYPSRMLSVQDIVDRSIGKWVEEEQIASVEHKGKVGYVLNTQEVLTYHHLLAIFCRKKISRDQESITAANQILENNGLLILPHGYVNRQYPTILPEFLTQLPRPIPQILKFYMQLPRLITPEEELSMWEIAYIADEIDVFDASIPESILFEVRDANNMAKAFVKLLKNSGKKIKGVATSDSHDSLSSIFGGSISFRLDDICDNGVPCVEGITSAIRNQRFDRHEAGISMLEILATQF